MEAKECYDKLPAISARRRIYGLILFILFAFTYISVKYRVKYRLKRDSELFIRNFTFSETHLVIHSLCDTHDNRDLVNLPMTQDGLPAVVSVLAGSSKKSSQDTSFLEEIDFLMMFERNYLAMASHTFYTHCFLDWQLKLTIECEVIGYGSVQGEITLSYRYNMHKEGRLRCAVDSLKIPVSTNLVVRLIDREHQLNGSVKLCLLYPYRKIHKLVGCSQPLYNVGQLEARWPGLIRMWIQFHIRYLNFGAVNIYDIDGSTEPYIKGLVKKGTVNYYKRWAPTESMLNLSLSGSTYCAETMMENQCLWQHRGLSEWVMLIHAPDNYLNDSAGAPVLTSYLDSIKSHTALTLVQIFVFGHPNVDLPKQQHANNLFGAIITRECNPVFIGRELPIANPRQVMMLFVHLALEPFNGVPTTMHTCPVRVNHYVTMFRSRSIHDPSTPAENFCNDSTLHEQTKSYLSRFN